MENTSTGTGPVANRPVASYSMGQPPEKKSSLGAAIGVIIVVVLIVLGGLYFWGKQLASPTDSSTTMSTSDDVAAIETDLTATNVDNVDAGAASVDAELQ